METNDADSKTVYYSDKISVVDGKIELVSPSTLIVQSRKPAQCNNNLPGKYITDCYTANSSLFPGKDDVFYIDPSATFSYSSSTGYLITTEKAYLVSIEVQYSDWEYVQSSSRSAYPDSGEQGGYEYQYLGIPFDNAVAAPKIVTGSYVGTGKYGSSNPNSLTFDFEPKFIMISSIERNEYFSIFPCFSLPENYPSNVGYGWSGLWNGTLTAMNDNYAKLVDNTLSWYYKGGSSASVYQLNSSDTTYTYLAIG